MNIIEFRQLGEHFMFLSNDCIVTTIFEGIETDDISRDPNMTAAYVDRHGIFQFQTFTNAMLPALINENPDNISAVSLTREDILDVLIREHDELIAKNATSSGLSMQGGYNDGVRDLFHKLHMRLI